MKRFSVLFLTVALLATLASALGQGNADVQWRAIYQGELDGQPVTLDLALGANEFAFGRLTRAGSPEVLDGVGTHDLEEATVQLELRIATAPLATSVALDYAYLDGQNPDVLGGGAGPVSAVLNGTRSVDWSNDGDTMEATLQFIEAGSVSGTLTRVAQYAYGNLVEGRIDLGYAYPRFGTDNNELDARLEEAAVGRLTDWAQEGRGLLDDDQGGGLGWAWTHSESTDLQGAAGAYLSLLTSFYYYTGGAHPNSHSQSLLVRKTESGVQAVELAELFDPSTDWLAEVTSQVVADLAAQGAEWVVTGEVTADAGLELATFTLEPAGLTFHFDPYAVGPYVQGAFRVTLPYADLTQLAAAGGALETFATEYAPD